MASIHPLRPEPPSDPPDLHGRAIDNLRFIRETMERAAAFTAVPGRGMVAIGAAALLVSLPAARQTTVVAWLSCWLGVAFVAVGIAARTMSAKARRHGVPLGSGAGRRTLLGLLPPMVAAVPLTVALPLHGEPHLLPGLWLLLYGCAVVTGGAASPRVVPAMGICFALLGALALARPDLGDLWLALGFGGFHLLFGAVIARRYGG